MPYIFVGQNGTSGSPGTWTNGTFTGNVTVGGTLGVTGAATIGTTLGVTGASTLAAVGATTLNTSGLATLASAAVTGAATVGTTLGVTGAITGASYTGGAISGTTVAASSNATVGGTLGVTGAITGASYTGGAISGTSVTASAAVTGATVAATGNATVGGTLGVTGISTFTGGVATPMNYKNGSTTVSTVDAAGFNVPTAINPSTLYLVDDFCSPMSATISNQIGTNSISAANGIVFPLMTAANMGVIYAGVTAANAGGYCATTGAINVFKSASATWRWRWIFRMPAAGSGSNRYQAIIGGASFSGASAIGGGAPAQGPFLRYTDNVNLGNWVIGSTMGAGTITTSTSTAPSFNAWSTAECTLVNGTYTWVVNGATIGTVVDTNMTAASQLNQAACLGGVACLADPALFTTASYVLMDRAECYITGLSR